MSEFAPGFAGRIHAAAHVLQRAFGEGTAFAAADVGSIGRRGFEQPAPVSPRHFSPADPGANPTEGWDPFAAEVPVSPTVFVDPIAAAQEAGFAEGRAAALA